ncbi:hypothetical protein EDC30_1189 [Paucimonas lemoignei]|uniref:Probable membrane transporter protein n=1 Tax=Paucimonas lemoignei TaxID=29443 RepID=A0A4R3HPE7_PAULE|nr:sulfite exporter TauE/SafE family protein [Paucimonas lemoignei]TCS33068.1 hypothetical protein EDC30_1189 [Paucimonas lemoignei]
MAANIGLGLIVGAIMALTGAGGGILAVPLLVFGLHMSVADAGPIGLLAVGIAALLGTVLGLKEGVVRYRAALLMAAMGVVLSPVGVWLAKRTDAQWLSVIFGAVLLFVAYRTFRQANEPEPAQGIDCAEALPCVRSAADGRFVWTSQCARALGTAGAVAGLLSGLLGVGGGFVMVPCLRRYSDLDTQSIIATSLAVTALIAVSGVIFSASSGNFDWLTALPFAGGAVGGIIMGKIISHSLKGEHLQKGFATVAVAVGIGMLIKAFI